MFDSITKALDAPSFPPSFSLFLQSPNHKHLKEAPTELADGTVRATAQPAEKPPRRETSAPAVYRPPV